MPGIAAISETHLTQEGVRRFQAEVAMNCKGSKFHPGHPVPARGGSIHSTGGKHSGVGFITACPARPVMHHWSEELGSWPRRHVCHFLVDQTWVTGGVFYGPSMNSERREVKDYADSLLREVVQVVEPQVGPRFVAGDFNQTTMPIIEWLETQGWLDAQTLALQKWNVTPMNTCKATSRKDFIMMCPRLIPHVQAVALHHNTFPDHSIIDVTLSNLGSPQPIPRWFKPGIIHFTPSQAEQFRDQWQQSSPETHCQGDTCLMTAVSQTGCGDPQEQRVARDPTLEYARMWTQWENEVEAFKRRQNEEGLLDHQRGRGQTTRRTFHIPRVHTIKAPRAGETQVDCCRPTLQLKRWIQQLRRVINLARNLRTGNTSLSRTSHVSALWKAIRGAKGFQPNFETWWYQRPVQGEGTYAPRDCVPTYAEAQQMQDQLDQNVRFLTKQLNQQRVQETKARHARDTNRVFQDVKVNGAQPVETLLDLTEATILEVPDESTVILTEECQFESGKPIYGDHLPLHIDIMDRDQIWFTQPHTLQPGMKLTQRTPVGSLTDVFNRFAQEWLKRWDKHRNITDDHWNHIVQFTGSLSKENHAPGTYYTCRMEGCGGQESCHETESTVVATTIGT